MLERDRLSTERLREETSRLELTAIEVDLELAQADLVDRVAGLFGLVQRK